MLELKPGEYIKGRVKLPGSKSISNRLLMLEAVMQKTFHLKGISDADDTQLLQRALKIFREGKLNEINIGDAGTDMRFLTAFLSLQHGEWTLTGSARMKERPIAPLVNALKQLGANLSYAEKEGFPPLRIKGQELNGGNIAINSDISSQFVSALLISAPLFKNGLEIELLGSTVSKPYILMTLELMKEAGLHAEVSGKKIKVDPLVGLKESYQFDVESDWSAASYWYSVCALSKNPQLQLESFCENSLQADAVLPQVFEQLGVKTKFSKGTLLLKKNPLTTTTFEYDFTDCPDIAQTIAVTCFGLGIEARLTGLKTLKIKETDRLTALKTELVKMGGEAEITPDSIHIYKVSQRKPFSGAIHCYNDHRMAMSFAPLALIYGALRIDDPMAVSKSYRGFWEDLKSVGFNVNLQPN